MAERGSADVRKSRRVCILPAMDNKCQRRNFLSVETLAAPTGEAMNATLDNETAQSANANG